MNFGLDDIMNNTFFGVPLEELKPHTKTTVDKISLEKAIEIIKYLTYRLSNDGYIRQANEMAIKALKREIEMENGIDIEKFGTLDGDGRCRMRHCNKCGKFRKELDKRDDGCEYCNGWYIDATDVRDVAFKYCPMCGRKMVSK